MALEGQEAAPRAWGKAIKKTEMGFPKWGWAGRKTQRT